MRIFAASVHAVFETDIKVEKARTTTFLTSAPPPNEGYEVAKRTSTRIPITVEEFDEIEATYCL